MKIAPVADVKARLSAYLRESEKGPIIVTRNGKPVAVLIAVQDEDELERLMLAHSPRLRSILETGKRQIGESGGMEHKEFWQQVEAGKDEALRGSTPSASATTLPLAALGSGHGIGVGDLGDQGD